MDNENNMVTNGFLDSILEFLKLPYTYVALKDDENSDGEIYFFLNPENKDKWDLLKNENSSYVIHRVDVESKDSKWIYSTNVCTHQGDIENPPEYDVIDSQEFSTKESAIFNLIKTIETDKLNYMLENFYEAYLLNKLNYIMSF